ncbi:MAG: hypothetical protein WBW04_19620, partial [Nitrolancea sp.]
VIFGLCLGAAFGAGTIYGRHSKTPDAAAAGSTTFNRGAGANSNGSSTSTATSTASGASGTPQASGSTNGAPGFFGGFGGRPLEATVSAVNDADLQVTLSFGGAGGNGNSTNIAVSSETTYATAKKADKSAITSGATVYVATSAASDGTLTATSVIVLPSGAQSNSNQPPTGGSGAATGPSGFTPPNGQGTGPFGASGGGFANQPIEGTVASINGQQLQITLANGSTSRVTLSDQTTYETTQSADKSAVTAGASVLITTGQGSDGGFSAESVVVLPDSHATN